MKLIKTLTIKTISFVWLGILFCLILFTWMCIPQPSLLAEVAPTPTPMLTIATPTPITEASLEFSETGQDRPKNSNNWMNLGLILLLLGALMIDLNHRLKKIT